MFTHFISHMETHEFFQVELVSLLVSLIVSLLLQNSFPYFLASALCLLTTAAALTFELFSHVAGQHSYLEATTTLTFAVITSGTFVYTLVKRLSNVELRWHTITALGFWSYLALRAVWILEDTARPIHLDVDHCGLEAAGFAAMHLMATILMLNDSTISAPPTPESEVNEKATTLV